MPGDDRAARLGTSIPSRDLSGSLFVGARRAGDLVITSGFGPFLEGRHTHVGRVGLELTVEQAKDAAWIAALNCLGALRDAVGSLDRVASLVRVTGFVNAAEGFTTHPAVVDGASECVLAVLGSRGLHARAALGVASLPFNIPVEVELTAQVEVPS